MTPLQPSSITSRQNQLLLDNNSTNKQIQWTWWMTKYYRSFKARGNEVRPQTNNASTISHLQDVQLLHCVVVHTNFPATSSNFKGVGVSIFSNLVLNRSVRFIIRSLLVLVCNVYKMVETYYSVSS